jgi:hypothetical protein
LFPGYGENGFIGMGSGSNGLENKGLWCRFFVHFSADKIISGFFRVAVCASDLQDKELEFFLKRFLKMNYW